VRMNSKLTLQDVLTPKQFRVALLVTSGLKNSEIAMILRSTEDKSHLPSYKRVSMSSGRGKVQRRRSWCRLLLLIFALSGPQCVLEGR
jgi:hypothetical protein